MKLSKMFSKKKADPQSKQQMEQEYASLCAKLGETQYRHTILGVEVKELTQKLTLLNKNYHEVFQAKEATDATKAPAKAD